MSLPLMWTRYIGWLAQELESGAADADPVIKGLCVECVEDCDCGVNQVSLIADGLSSAVALREISCNVAGCCALSFPTHISSGRERGIAAR